jgi:hypothetical protein
VADVLTGHYIHDILLLGEGIKASGKLFGEDTEQRVEFDAPRVLFLPKRSEFLPFIPEFLPKRVEFDALRVLFLPKRSEFLPFIPNKKTITF